MNYTYDMAGDLTSSTNGEGVTIDYNYDAVARPSSVTSSLVDSQHPATLATVDPTQGYFPSGALHKLTLGNGFTETAAFTNRLQPCRMNVNSSGAVLNTCTDTASSTVLDLSYNFDPGTNNGNLMNMIASGAQTFNRSYTYDALNRLLTLNSTGSGGSFAWSYDAWGTVWRRP